MQNEKLRILKLLENGQITAAEAAQLLQAVGSEPSHHMPPPPPAPPTSYTPHVPPPPPSHHAPPPHHHHSHTSHAGYTNNGGRPSAPMASGVDDLSRKFESFAREMAPKVQRFTETVADKIVGAADRVSGAFVSEAHPHHPPHPHTHGQSHRPPAPGKPYAPPGGVVERNIEMPVDTGGYNELNLSCLNGELRIKGYNGDKITARLAYRGKSAAAHIEFVKLGGKYFLKYEPDDFHMVTIDAFVPERAFSVVKLDGLNAQLDCSSLAANEIKVENSNGTTRLAGLSAVNIVAESSSGAFSASNIIAQSGSIENMNGAMDISELDISNLKISNYNGPVSVIMSKYERYAEYMWSVETGNAKLNMNMPTLPDLGYHIKAHAAMSEIRLGLTGLQFLINEPSLVEARSVYFDSSAKKVKLAVETSNAPLVIN